MQLPDRQTVIDFTCYYLAASFAFVLVYGTTNYITFHRVDHAQLYFQWEARLPFMPQFIYGYLSIMLVFMLPLFSLNTIQIRRLSIAFVAATLVAGVVYLLLPAELPHARPDSTPSPQWLFTSLYAIALPHNLLPSLHITYSTLILLAIAKQERSRVITTIAVMWMALICLSVILVRQHQVVDIIGGWALGWLSYVVVYRAGMYKHS